jgi:hypothetical protein
VSATVDVAHGTFVSAGSAAGGARLRLTLRGSLDESTVRPREPSEARWAVDETIGPITIVVSMDNEPDDIALIRHRTGPAQPRRTVPR